MTPAPVTHAIGGDTQGAGLAVQFCDDGRVIVSQGAERVTFGAVQFFQFVALVERWTDQALTGPRLQ